MKKGFQACTAAIALFTASAAVAQERDPVTELSEAYDNMANGKYDLALETLIWCFDQGPTIEPAFDALKTTCVIDALSTCVEAYPPALTTIRAKRDAKMSQVGDTVDFKSPALKDAMLLNIVLADFAKNQELVQHAAKEGTVKKFASAAPPPTIPAFHSPTITKRVQGTVQLIQVADDPTAAETLRLTIGRCGNDLKFVQDEEKVIIKEIADLKAQVKSAKTSKDKALVAEKLSKKAFTLEKDIKPLK
jgi:hypothetical protein